jgi:TonB family protein
MRVTVRLFATLVSLTLAAAGCGTPPSEDVDAARASVNRANTEGASKYAAESLKAAQSAQAELDAELKAQEGKMIKSYDRARELAVAAKAAGDKAVAEAAAGRERAEAAAAKVKAAAAARAKARAAAVRVGPGAGGNVRPPIKIKDVRPVYPAIAQTARVSGAVVIEAMIDADGKVADATVIKSIPLLDQAALDAVKQWEYRPSLLNGKPVPVVMTVTVNFTRQ